MSGHADTIRVLLDSLMLTDLWRHHAEDSLAALDALEAELAWLKRRGGIARSLMTDKQATSFHKLCGDDSLAEPTGEPE